MCESHVKYVPYSTATITYNPLWVATILGKNTS